MGGELVLKMLKHFWMQLKRSKGRKINHNRVENIWCLPIEQRFSSEQNKPGMHEEIADSEVWPSFIHLPSLLYLFCFSGLAISYCNHFPENQTSHVLPIKV